MGCCNNQAEAEDREVPDGVNPCCHIRGKRCICLPYDDPFMITAQVLSIVATLVSWIYWATWLVSLIGMVLFQVLWCCRMGSAALYAPTIIAGITSLGSLAVAIYVVTKEWSRRYCEPFTLMQWYGSHCPQWAWFGVAFACFLLWAVAAGCTFWFVKSGRHARWEAIHTPSKVDEMEMVEGEQQPQAVVADAAVLECEKEDSADGNNV